jgi:endonuclease/exonuclease/phosphatase family metal-dependent hydrolase
MTAGFKLLLSTLLTSLLLAGLPASAQTAPQLAPQLAPQTAPRLRVLTYNIHHGEGTDGKLDLARIARVISDQKPDLVSLQELDVKTRRTGGVDEPAELAKLTGMKVAFGKGIDYQGGQYGNAVLSRFMLQSTKVHPLPGKEGAEKRCALAVVLKPWPQGPALTFVATHLDHTRDETDRLAQADEIKRLLTSDEGAAPMILAGDFNAVPASETMKRLGRWTDAGAEANAPTDPSDKPRSRIDYVLLRPSRVWHVVETSVIDEPVASDHRPVLAVLEWRGEPVLWDGRAAAPPGAHQR